MTGRGIPRPRLVLSLADLDRLNKCWECCPVASCDECGPCHRHDLPPEPVPGPGTSRQENPR